MRSINVTHKHKESHTSQSIDISYTFVTDYIYALTSHLYEGLMVSPRKMHFALFGQGLAPSVHGSTTSQTCLCCIA